MLFRSPITGVMKACQTQLVLPKYASPIAPENKETAYFSEQSCKLLFAFFLFVDQRHFYSSQTVLIHGSVVK